VDTHITPETGQNEDLEFSPLARLVQLGREKTYITFDDILRYFPYPELDLPGLDLIFAALMEVGVTIGAGAEFTESNEE